MTAASRRTGTLPRVKIRRGGFPASVLLYIAIASISSFSPSPAQVQDVDGGQGFLRFPDTNGSDVVFTSEGDLWTAPLSGGIARRLTTDEGEERFAHFSPDGKRIAFSAQYGGNFDIFVIPAEGGVPKRLTYHPALDQVVGWTPDGKVLFRSRRDNPEYDWRLYKVSPEGGDPDALPLTQAALASFSPDGRRLAFTRFSLEWHHWKQYQGGWAQDIYAGDLATGEYRQITDFKGMDAFPMWSGEKIYFLSDRDGVANLYSMSPDGTGVRRITDHKEADVRWPSLGAGQIVYQVAYDIWSCDLATGSTRRLDVRLPSDRVRTLPRVVDPKEQIQGYALGKDGRRLVLCARGDLFAVPTKKGRIIPITGTQGVRERSPVCSPDGSTVAYLSDATGEEEVYTAPATGGSARQVTTGSSCYHYQLAWSPDGQWIAYSDRTLGLFLVDVAKGTKQQVTRSAIYEIRNYSFSPDSRWVAWSEYAPNMNRTIRIRAVAGGPITSVTDAMTDSWEPAWDPEGKYLYFLSRRTINPYMAAFEENFAAMNGTKPYLLVLKAGEPSPFAPKDEGEETAGDEDATATEGVKAEGAKKAGAPKGADGKPGEAKPVEVAIDIERIQERIAAVPVDAGNCAMLQGVPGRILWLDVPNDGMGSFPEDEDEEREGNASLHSFSIEDKEEHVIATEIDDYSVSPDGTRLAYRSGPSFTVIDAGADEEVEGEELEEAKVDLSFWEMTIDPVAEWRQIFAESWRLERDFFWDTNMLGVNWPAMRERYGALLPRVTTRDELNDLLGELIAELRTSHEYLWGGDDPGRAPRGVGRLGVDLAVRPETGRVQITRIYGPDRWDGERSSPLLLPGQRVNEGDYLVAIDGAPVSSVEETHAKLAGKSGKPVLLTVATTADGSDRRDIYVETMKSDDDARYDQWVRDRRSYVERRSGGRVGYIHIPDMDLAGIVEFNKQFFPQSDKEGLIVDVRNNAGGYAHSMILERLYRKLWSFAIARYMRPFRTPGRAFYGHMVALCDQRTGSDGESFAEAFKRMKLGPMIGMRTWGGFVGIRGGRGLVDGGGITQPEWPSWGFDRTWLVEGEGVIPDIQIDNDPTSTARGLDPQLDRAIQEVLDLMTREPMKIPEPPPYPVKAPAGR
jgi:tricorn protease